MPDPIQFACPSCAATLRLQPETSGKKGPCPKCRAIIIAPDIETGAPARVADEPVPTTPPAPERPAPTDESNKLADSPFSKNLPAPVHRAPVRIPDPSPVSSVRVIHTKAAPTPSERIAPDGFRKMESQALSPDDEPEETERHGKKIRRKKPSPVPVIAITAAIAFGLGYFVGKKSSSASPAQATPVRPAVTIDAALPPKSNTPEAEETLNGFLKAPNWSARSAFVISPDSTRPKMEADARQHPDGPISFESVSVKYSQADANSTTRLLVYEVLSAGEPKISHVAVLKTYDGWRVDWNSFVEFRDDRLTRFIDGSAELAGEFHVIVRPASPSANASPENQEFASYILSPPMADRQRVAFVKRSSPVYSELLLALEKKPVFLTVAELAKRTLRDGRTYLEILSIKSNDWRP